MKKRLVKISQCSVGDKLAMGVVSRAGVTIVAEGTVLNEFIINKLRKMGIDEVYIAEEQISKSQKEIHYEEFGNDYKNKVNEVKYIITNLATGKKLDYLSVVNISKDMKKHVEEKDNIIKFLSTLKAFDQYTYNHSMNVAFYSMLLGKWLNLSEKEIDELSKAALMHDIGKAKIPDAILNKRGPLNDMEFNIMRKHSQYGYEIAKDDSRINVEVLKGILMHHEREDGSGYPLKLKGDKIGYFAKIIAVCDVYDALTQERVYKGRMTPFDAFKIIETDGYTTFDTKILLTFLHNIASYYIGMEVVLSDGRQGEIVYITPMNVSYPIVKVEDELIDLMRNKDIKIVSLLN